MEIFFNGISNPSNLICFDGVPNIIKITDTDSGRTGQITLSFNSGLTATGDGQYSITILDNTIVNVLNPSEAVGQNFFASDDRVSTAFSVAMALRACPNVTANYIVQYNSTFARVTLYARQKGSIFNQYSIPAQTNIPSSRLTLTATDGTSTSPLNNANVSVNLIVDGYTTTIMNKNVHNGEVAFDLSSILGSRAEYGKLKSFLYDIYLLDNSGSVTRLYYGNVYNYFTHGYKTKDSNDYLILSNTPQIALAVDRGTSRNVFNNTLLYVYDNTIPLTLYRLNTATVSYSVKYYDSAFNQLGTSSGSQSIGLTTPDLTIQLNPTYFTPNCFYVDVTIGNETVRYNVIKPLKMTEENTRLYWRNEYGGIQFFDFTGSKSETRERDEATYHNGNAIFDYYSATEKAYEGVYKVNVDEKINVSSHLIEKDGRWQFDSLVRAKKVWTIIDGVQYDVIIDSVSVEETEQNDIYRASVQFHTAELQ